MKKIKKSLLIAFLITMIGALLIGGSTVAWFTSEAENTDNTFTSGTLEISLDKPKGTQYFNITNIAPGDDGSAELVVSNTGSLALSFNFGLTEDGALFEGSYPLVISIKDRNGNAVSLDATMTLESGASETYTVSWEMPTGADDSYQNQSGTLGIKVSAEQISD